jgi:short-subunit dehydrogenase
MQWPNSRIVLSGGSGGIGQCVAGILLARGASVTTISRSNNPSDGARHFAADLSSTAGIASAVRFLEGEETDILINLAGVQYFGPAEQQTYDDIEATYAINLIAPVQLSRAVVPGMKRRGTGQVVNIGSILGSIGLAYFATYSSSKAGLRMFSEALRRELAGTGIAVTYIAPRAARTGLITRKLAQYADLTGMAIDEPDQVAGRIVDAIARRETDVYFGAAERIFVKLNGALPRMVDFFQSRNDRKARTLFSPQNVSSGGTSP